MYYSNFNIIDVFSIIWIGDLITSDRFESCINICPIILNLPYSSKL
jgi:hypothetical protein